MALRIFPIAAFLASFVTASACVADAPAGTDAAPRRGGVEGFLRRLSMDDYVLDDVSRYPEAGTFQCPEDALTFRRGTAMRYVPTVRVHRAFEARLERFEQLVTELAVETYGRAPSRILHSGAYNCRNVRGGSGRVSEHAFGNAIDVTGFDFPRIRRVDVAPADLPPRLRRAFAVRVGPHWDPRRAVDGRHAAFLHGLADRLARRPDIFRGIVGPPRPRHHDHLHFDASPWGYALYDW